MNEPEPSCHACKRTDRIRRYPGATRRVPGDGPGTIEVPCSCTSCGAEWSERYRLAGADPRDELLEACRGLLAIAEDVDSRANREVVAMARAAIARATGA